MKDPCGGSGARKVGTGRVTVGVAAGAAAEVTALWAVAAADTAFLSWSSALTPGSRKLAAKTFVAGGGFGWRLDMRELVGGEPRFCQAWRARSLLAAAASSLSSLRQVSGAEKWHYI